MHGMLLGCVCVCGGVTICVCVWQRECVAECVDGCGCFMCVTVCVCVCEGGGLLVGGCRFLVGVGGGVVGGDWWVGGVLVLWLGT